MEYLATGFIALFPCFGIYIIWSSIRQLQLTRYLREHGIQTSGVAVEAVLITSKNSSHIRLKVAYRDQQEGVHQAKFSDKNLYTVGSAVAIYYDPLRPQRAALATDVESPSSQLWAIFFGIVWLTLTLFIISKIYPELHDI